MCGALGLLAAGGGGAAAGGAAAGSGGLFGTSFLSGLGLGTAATNALVADLFLTGTQQAIAANQANQRAQFLGKQAAQQAESANLAFAREQEGLGARLKEDRKANAQEQIALAKQGARAAGALRSSERAGLTIDL